MKKNRFKKKIALALSLIITLGLLQFPAGAVSYSDISYGGNVLSGTTITVPVDKTATFFDLTKLLFSVPTGISYNLYQDSACTLKVNGMTEYSLAANGNVVYALFAGDGADLKVTVRFSGDPVYQSVAITAYANKSYTFKSSDFAVSSLAGTVTTIKINTLPATGTLLYNSMLLGVMQEIPIESISSLTYKTSSLTADSFTFSIKVGSAYLDMLATMTINIAGIAAPPTISGFTKAAPSTDAVKLDFTKEDFANNYYSGKQAGELSYITIKSLPSALAGTLYLGTAALQSGSTIRTSSLASLYFKVADTYTSAADFTWTASDADGLTSGMATTIVTRENFAPELADFRISTPKNIALAFSTGSFINWFSDLNGNSLYVLKITSLPSADIGTLYNGSNKVAVGLQLLPGDLANLRFVPAAGFVGTAGFTWNASDGKAYANRDALCSVYVTDNTVPLSGDFKKVVASNRTLAFNINDFKAVYTVQDNAPLASIKITGSPSSSYGALYLKGVAVTADTVISSSNLGGLVFVPVEGVTGTTAMKYVASSNGATYSATPGTVTIRVSSVLPYTMTSNSDTIKSASVSLTAAAPDAAGGLSCTIDSLTVNDIANSLRFTGGTLTLSLPALAGTVAKSRSFQLDSSIFTSGILYKLKAISFTDGTAVLTVSTDSMSKAAGNGTITVVLSDAAVDAAASTTGAGSARQVSIVAGDTMVTALSGRNAVKLSLPYVAADTMGDLAVMMKLDAGVYSPLTSSRYDAVSKTVTASISPQGIYVPSITSVSFTDVPVAHWANTYIKNLSSRKVIEGMGDGLFAPDGTLTRAQLIKLLVTSLDLYDGTAVCSFTDVAPAAWYYPYVASAVKAGILTDGGKFNPDVGITREDMCVFSYLAAVPAGFTYPASIVGTGTFTDEKSISAAAVTSVKVLKNAGIITGYPDGSIKPKGTLTRAEASKIIYMIRLLQ